jgi:hypothetical protein
VHSHEGVLRQCRAGAPRYHHWSSLLRGHHPASVHSGARSRHPANQWDKRCQAGGLPRSQLRGQRACVERRQAPETGVQRAPASCSSLLPAALSPVCVLVLPSKTDNRMDADYLSARNNSRASLWWKTWRLQ